MKPCPYQIVCLQVINDRFGIVEGLMTTVHAITGMIFEVPVMFFIVVALLSVSLM